MTILGDVIRVFGMPRQPRIEYAGGVYHVLSRGNRQEAIFADDTDRQVFLKTLGEACGRTGWRVHAYVLMPNHYHLLLETPEANLVVGMQWLQGPTAAVQRATPADRSSLPGPIQGPIDRAGRRPLFHRRQYVHPPESGAAGMVAGGEAAGGLRLEQLPRLLETRLPAAMAVCGANPGLSRAWGRPRGRLEYRRFMDERVATVASSKDRANADPIWSIRRGWYLGGEAFLESLLGRLDDVRPASPGRACAGCNRRAQ